MYAKAMLLAILTPQFSPKCIQAVTINKCSAYILFTHRCCSPLIHQEYNKITCNSDLCKYYPFSHSSERQTGLVKVKENYNQACP